jgi:hypothetical protein
LCVTDDLVATAIEAAGGQKLWNTLRGLTVDLSVGGPVWVMKGWPPGTTFEQKVTLNTVDEYIEFSPFTRPDWRMTFDAATDTVALQTLDGAAVGTLAPARAAFKGHLRPTPWDAQHLGYFLGYANWNYFTTPFLSECPGVAAIEIEPWHEAGQTWRRLQVRFPPSIATHNPEQVFTSTQRACSAEWITSPKFWAAPSSAITAAGTAASADCALPPADGSSDATRTTPSI